MADEIEQVFNKFDTNGDGKISATELLSILQVLGSSETSQEDVERAMSELDTDGDGFIDLTEFKTFHCRSGNEVELKEAFDLYDKDKDGKISATELHAVLSSLGERSSVDDSQKMIETFDVDGDGFVNFEEFKKMMNPTPP